MYILIHIWLCGWVSDLPSRFPETRLLLFFWSEELYLEGYDYSLWSENKEQLTDKEELTDVPPIPPLEGDEEEAKEGKGLKNFNSKKIIYQSANIISIDKSRKQFMQIKKWNQANTVSA